jgi:hypothetical protein
MVSIKRIKVNEYTPIRSLLHHAAMEHEGYHDQNISDMVRDAIAIAGDVEYKIRANRRMFRYSFYLSAHCAEVVRRMNPDSLTREDYRILFEIFEHL